MCIVATDVMLEYWILMTRWRKRKRSYLIFCKSQCHDIADISHIAKKSKSLLTNILKNNFNKVHKCFGYFVKECKYVNLNTVNI